MAITQYSPNTLTGIIRNDTATPFGGFAAPVSNTSQPYSIHNLPSRLRGIGIEHSVKVVNYLISDAMYAQSGNDPAFRDMVKHDLSRMIAEEIFQVAKFTQIKDPHTFDVKVIGRVVIMTEDQLNKLIQAVW